MRALAGSSGAGEHTVAKRAEHWGGGGRRVTGGQRRNFGRDVAAD